MKFVWRQHLVFVYVQEVDVNLRGARARQHQHHTSRAQFFVSISVTSIHLEFAVRQQNHLGRRVAANFLRSP
jgi:hypothetical protein